MNRLLALCALLCFTACDAAEKAPISGEPPGFCSGEQLFGNPNATTGLTAEQCTPTCTDCGAVPYLPPTFDDAALATLTSLVNDTPASLLTGDPYAEGSADTIPDGSVCAVTPTTPGHYRLDTFASASAPAASEPLDLVLLGGCRPTSIIECKRADDGEPADLRRRLEGRGY